MRRRERLTMTDTEIERELLEEFRGVRITPAAKQAIQRRACVLAKSYVFIEVVGPTIRVCR